MAFLQHRHALHERVVGLPGIDVCRHVPLKREKGVTQPDVHGRGLDVALIQRVDADTPFREQPTYGSVRENHAASSYLITSNLLRPTSAAASGTSYPGRAARWSRPRGLEIGTPPVPG